jgi:predicted transcriptional regulator
MGRGEKSEGGKMKLTQRDLVYQYILENGSFIPARERNAAYKGKLLGSQADRRARELRKQGLVRSEQVGRFERYFPPQSYKSDTAVKEPMVNLEELKRKRDDLRRQWKEAKEEDRRIIEVRGKAITRAIEQLQFETNVKEQIINQ